MDTGTKTTLAIAFASIALLLLLFGGEMTTMSGGMVGNGSMGGI